MFLLCTPHSYVDSSYYVMMLNPLNVIVFIYFFGPESYVTQIFCKQWTSGYRLKFKVQWEVNAIYSNQYFRLTDKSFLLYHASNGIRACTCCER